MQTVFSHLVRLIREPDFPLGFLCVTMLSEPVSRSSATITISSAIVTSSSAT